MRIGHAFLLFGFLLTGFPTDGLAQELTTESVTKTMRKAARFYREDVATHGGYVYVYDIDLDRRWGEGEATKDQIWVQPPGTPTVGLAYLKAYQATGDQYFLEAARDAANALVYGQVKSGGWTNCIDFDPRGKRVSQYRNGRGRGRNTSSLDDGQTATALLFLIRMDETLKFQDETIHEATKFGLNALLDAQFPNGAFPQVWQGEPNPDPPIVKPKFPDYDWRTEGRIKAYWNLYTLNDNVPGTVANTLIAAHEVYQDEKYSEALKKLGDFLILAQMPDPQPAWAQQYNYDMIPVWARKFEPPGISGDESQETIKTLMLIYRVTGDRKYLEPIPAALDYLEKSLLPDNQLARYYELETNKPLYMQRRGKVYSLTYDDSNLPDHYGWKTGSKLPWFRQEYAKLSGREWKPSRLNKPREVSDQEARRIVEDLDEFGRWVTISKGEKLIGDNRFAKGEPYLASEVFSKNLERLSDYLLTTDQTRRSKN
ncbi:pectate lyase [Thalassoroseus pseudoceratinae]|uniref:pectate lyase n=1 Tax=Thalassoroseus pseudoceratinae TaxID=2713176 RepID=UPI00141E6A63|nr:pectate lyase [Thalassoroseus pseudoceratinae]